MRGVISMVYLLFTGSGKDLSEDDVSYGLEETIRKILQAKPEITREELLKKFDRKRMETGYLLNLEGAAFLVANDLGVILQDRNQLETRIKIKDVISKLRDVTIVGRLIMIYPIREFARPDGSVGRLQRLFIGDESGTTETCIWNNKIDEYNLQKISVNSIIKIEHAYSRESMDGQFELHIGDRSRITVIIDENSSIPTRQNFFRKIYEAQKGMKNFNFIGIVARVFPVKQFNRADGEGKVQRLRIRDDSGEINLVIWDSKLEEIESVDVNDKIEVLRSSIRENMFGELEAHTGKRSMIQVLAKGVGNISDADFKPLMISQISPGLRNFTVEAVIASKFGVRNVNLKDGSVVKVSELMLKDDTGEIKLSAWREHAEMISQFPSGTRIKLKNIISKPGFREGSELTTTNSTIIELIPSENHIH